ERLPVELDPGALQAVHELVVGEAVRAGRGVDAHDPERAEVPLLVAPVAVRVDERVLDLLLRVAVVRALAAVVPLRLLEHLAALLARGDRSLDTRHYLTPRSFLTAFTSTFATRWSLPKSRLRFDDFL